jgi:hypothetical protein
MSGPTFIDCIFDDHIPLIEGLKFKGCLFDITDIKNLPGIWQCEECFVNFEGGLYLYGQSTN